MSFELRRAISLGVQENCTIFVDVLQYRTAESERWKEVPIVNLINQQRACNHYFENGVCMYCTLDTRNR